MKTPNDLTDEEYEMLGLYSQKEAEEKDFVSEIKPNEQLFVGSAEIDAPLYESGITFKFFVWQEHGIVGGKHKYHFDKQYMAHVFNFVFDVAQFDKFTDYCHAIDDLLQTLQHGELS